MDEIDEIFVKIDDLIKDINKNRSSIEKCFKNLKSLINNDLEESNELLYNYYKFLFHNKQASFFKIIGKTEESLLQEKFYRKYEEFYESYLKSKKKANEKPEEEKKNSENPKKPNILFDELSKADENKIDADLSPEEIDKHLEKLKGFLDSNKIKALFQTIQTLPQNFTQYNMIIAAYSNWKQLYSEYLLGLSEDPDKNQMLIDELNSTGFVFEKQYYLTRVKFIENSVNDINLEFKLFDNISRTNEQIKKRYRELSAIFHPDKTSQWLEEDNKMISSKFFSQIIEIKNKLLNDIGENNNFTLLEQNAESFWAMALDYKNGFKKEWHKLKILEKDNILLHTQEELNKMTNYFAKAAYMEYKSCCRIADRKNNLKKQIQYRGKMALCLYECNDFIDSQLCAIASLKLIMKNSNSPYITYDDLQEAEKIFNKVKGLDEVPAEKKPKEKTENFEGALIEMGNRSLVVANKIDEGFSFMEKQKYMSNLNQNLEIISKKFLVQADKNLVKYVSPQSEILKAHQRADYYKYSGRIVNAVGVFAGAGMVVQGGASIVAAATGIGLLGPLGIVIGLVSIGLGFWGGNKLWKEGNTIRAEPIVRQKLNEIMMKALSNHENGKYLEFLEELSKEYEIGKRLVKLEKTGDALSCEYVIDELLKHGFRPDGISYLLNLLGEVLLSGKLKKLGIPDNDLKNEGQKAFYGALNEKLEKATKELDDTVCNMRAKSITGFFHRQINNYLGSKIAKEFVEDSESMPFSMRYEEMKNVARINIAIMRILKGDEQELKVAQNLLKEIKQSVEDHFQFVSISKVRLEVLEDFMWIVSGDFESEENEKKHVPMILQSSESLNDNYLCYLNEQLKLFTEKKKVNEQCEILNKKALYYIEKTKTEKFNSMINWKIALDLYKKSLELSEDEIKQKDAVLGYARCLLNLCKYQTMINLLKNKEHLQEYSEFWLYLGCAYRKQCNYKKAKEFIVEALRKNSKNIEAMQENAILEKLMKKQESEIVKKYEKNIFNQQTNSKSSNQKSKEKYFKILAVDGGGVRGIIPAIWLNEIEKSTHRPISQIFDMVSGTSTGGIIAMGLTIPNMVTNLPLYSTNDILDLYMTKSKNIFTRSSYIGAIRGPRYTDAGRYKVFSEYFGGATVQDCLTETLIPAVSEENLNQTYLFSRYDARKDPFRNDRMVDVLMATSAAPTFFPSYKIEGKGVFLDGGCHINNPAGKCFTEAQRYKVPKEDIFVLSLGTGGFMPDPLNPDETRGLLFWGQNFHKVALYAQEGNVDADLNYQIGNKYNRWQVWLEDPIALDDYKEKSLNALTEIAKQFIEEAYYSEENSMNKIIEFLAGDWEMI